MGDSHDIGGGGSKGFFGAFVFLVLVHLCFPGVETVLASVEQHAVAIINIEITIRTTNLPFITASSRNYNNNNQAFLKQ